MADIIEITEGAEEPATAVTSLLAEPGRARKRGTESRARVIAAYSWQRSMEEAVEILEDPNQSAPRSVLP